MGLGLLENQAHFLFHNEQITKNTLGYEYF